MTWQADVQDLTAASVGDALGGTTVLPARLRPIYPAASTFCGPAYTIALPAGDNLGLHYAIGRATPGSVIVASCSPDEEFGMWGEVLSRAAHAKGIRALVLDAYVRDTKGLADVGLPVYARGVSLRKSGKREPGEHGVALTLGPVTVRPADLVVGDSEGLVIVPSGQEVSTFSRAHEIMKHEAAMLASIDEGATTIELLELPPDPLS